MAERRAGARPAAQAAQAAVGGEVILDFSNVKPFEPIDPSPIYLCSVSALTIGKAKASGDPKSSLELTIVSPDEVKVEDWHENDKGELVNFGMTEKATKAKGRKLFREYSLNANALPFLYEFVKAADPTAVLNESFRYNPKNHIGLQVACKVKNEAYDEQIRPRVTKLLPASAAGK